MIKSINLFLTLALFSLVLNAPAQASELDNMRPVQGTQLEKDGAPMAIVVAEKADGSKETFAINNSEELKNADKLLKALNADNKVKVDAKKAELDQGSSAEASYYWSYWNNYYYVGCYNWNYNYWWSGSWSYWGYQTPYRRYTVYYPYYW